MGNELHQKETQRRTKTKSGEIHLQTSHVHSSTIKKVYRNLTMRTTITALNIASTAIILYVIYSLTVLAVEEKFNSIAVVMIPSLSVFAVVFIIFHTVAIIRITSDKNYDFLTAEDELDLEENKDNCNGKNRA